MRLRKGAFDGALLEWTPPAADDLGALLRGRGTGAYNFGGYASREVDQLLDVLRRPEQADGPRGEVRQRMREKLAAHLADQGADALDELPREAMRRLADAQAPARAEPGARAGPGIKAR